MKHLATTAALLALTAPALANDNAHPTVVELYQSQGCSSCPPANANLNRLAGRADVLALSFAVTYWDRLGWKDTFADPDYTRRQWDYAKAAGRPNVATPQVIVNGRVAANGGNLPRLIAAIRQGDRGATGPAIGFAAGKVTIGASRAAQPATVWLVRYDPREQQVAIGAGENGGRTLAHRNVVRALTGLGSWTGAPVSFAVPAAADLHWRTAVLVQAGTGGPIIAAARG